MFSHPNDNYYIKISLTEAMWRQKTSKQVLFFSHNLLIVQKTSSDISMRATEHVFFLFLLLCLEMTHNTYQ